MKRREFLRLSGGTAGVAAAAAAPVAAQEGTDTATPTDGGDGTATGTPANGTATTAEGGSLPGAGTTETVEVGPNNQFVFEPGTDEPLYIQPGTTVNFVWKSDNHNIVVESQPEDADWPGHETIENTGFEYSYTFEVTGTYEYYCAPHRASGMVGTIVVNESGQAPGAGEGGGEREVDPEEMGVPFQAHFVGIATLLGIVVALLFTFFFLKYGETPHSGYPDRD